RLRRPGRGPQVVRIHDPVEHDHDVVVPEGPRRELALPELQDRAKSDHHAVVVRGQSVELGAGALAQRDARLATGLPKIAKRRRVARALRSEDLERTPGADGFESGT